MNVEHLNLGFRVSVSWPLKKMLKMSTLIFHAGIAGDRLLGPYCLRSSLAGTVYYDYLQSVLPEMLRVVYLQSRFHL